MHFPDLGEFKFVDALLQKVAPLKVEAPSVRTWLGVGDDAAIFDGWVTTKDLSVENTHFRLDWSTPEQAVEKHIVSNVSDLSAMGAEPRIAFLGLCLNKHWSEEVKDRVRKALSEGFAKRGIALIGGDTVVGEEAVFSTTLLGVLAGKKPFLRSGVQPGNSLYVNGTLGKSDAGLWILMNHPEDAHLFPSLVEYHLCPRIEENAGATLARNGFDCAAMDISDGLSSELNHLALSSGVNLEIDQEKLPIDPEVVKMSEYYGISPLNFAMNGGEEYELLFAYSQSKSIFEGCKDCLGNVYRIGAAVEKSKDPRVYMRQENGDKMLVKSRAWSHL